MKHLRKLGAGKGKLAAAKRTTDLRMKMKMKSRAVKSTLAGASETSPDQLAQENAESGAPRSKKAIARLMNRMKLGRSAKRRARRTRNSELECSLLKWSTDVGTYTSPKIEALFKQRDLFKKDLAEISPAMRKKEQREDQPYVERRGRKKVPKDQEEKKDLFFQILKRRIEQKIKYMTVSEVDDNCFKCRIEGELLYCDNNACPRGYHLSCVSKTVWPTGKRNLLAACYENV